ncbi:MAG: hypothetical protein JJT90_15460, partial [Ectothiorhodospiraceae bacterium]|nr:hypothetical protein [Ectothiorhodospiraceae bacterium]
LRSHSRALTRRRSQAMAVVLVKNANAAQRARMARPTGLCSVSGCGVAALAKGLPLPASRALPPNTLQSQSAMGIDQRFL